MYADPFTHREGDNIVFKVDQVFETILKVRDALREYAVKGGYNIIRKKNDNQRVTAICDHGGCPWRFLLHF